MRIIIAHYIAHATHTHTHTNQLDYLAAYAAAYAADAVARASMRMNNNRQNKKQSQRLIIGPVMRIELQYAGSRETDYAPRSKVPLLGNRWRKVLVCHRGEFAQLHRRE